MRYTGRAFDDLREQSPYAAWSFDLAGLAFVWAAMAELRTRLGST